MKQIYFSLLIVGFLFSACSGNDASDDATPNAEGTLIGKISFDSKQTKASSSNAVPSVSWVNVKQVQLFLYDSTGKVAFSYTVKPTDANQTFTWTNVPVGKYRLALLANAKSVTDNVATSIDGSATELNDYNVRGKIVNSGIKIDLKQAELPDRLIHVWGGVRVGYAEPSEIFTAYHSEEIEIKEGAVTDLSSSSLVLKREVSLMRTRFNINEIPEKSKVHFDHSSGFITIQRLPVGFGFLTSSFGGGILDDSSDVNRVMVGATGTGTYISSDPTSGYYPSEIVDNNFTLWHDILVLPNAAISEGKGRSDDAASDRKYYIIIGAWVDSGYVYADGSIAEEPSPVYWYATINGVFTKNIIREVNMTLESAGYPEIPGGPSEDGDLTIVIGAPEDWDSTIESTDINA